MRRTWIIFLKELKDTLRDRRTLFMMIAMPLLLIPVMMGGIMMIESSQREKAEAKELKVVFLGSDQTPGLYEMFRDLEGLVFLEDVSPDSIENMIAREEVDVAVIVNEGFTDSIRTDQTGQITVVYKVSEDAYGMVKERILSVIDEFEEQLLMERVQRLNLNRNLFNAVVVEKIDVSSIKEKVGKLAGGWLPYMYLIFAFMGAMYPGLDLGAGEKERGSLETILSSPASRLNIVLGKFFVVMTTGMATALIAMGGVYLAITQFPGIPPELLSTILEMLGIKMILLVMTLVLPVTAFFSAMILSLSIYARSFKEAQSIVTPLNIAIMFPAFIGTLPGVELNSLTALIPVLNVSLATKDLLAGTINPVHLAEVYLSLFSLAALSLWGCVKWFNREETLFRN